jgi:hypothetical protein
MAITLLLTTALALAGFLLVSVQGFAVASGLSAGPAIARVLVARHVGYAIPTVLFSLFSQSMVIFYFIGTGRLVKDETVDFPQSDREFIVQTLARFKKQTSPAATLALASSIAVFVLGGAVHTRALPSGVHLASAVLAVALHVWALLTESRAFAENHRLMADPKAYARERAAG